MQAKFFNCFNASLHSRKLSSYSFCSFAKKKYILSQFPYPSGELHLGHARVYYIGDSLARYYRLKAYNVIYPMGFDSFGLPAENAAIIHNLNPKQWTEKNIESMIKQLNLLGVEFNWQNTFATSQSSYYRFTQEIFVKMFKKGLAYRGMGQVNWDPVDKTVLANQQVDKEGRSWRSGALVEKKQLQQWYFSITKYAKQLQNNLSKLEWIDRVKSMQQGWIGYREGYFVEMQLTDSKQKIKVFTNNLQDLLNENLVIRKNFEKFEELPKISTQVINPLTQQKIKIVSVHDNYIQYELILTGQQKRHELSQKVLDKLVYEKANIMRLKDWLISRQRYWGTPIPIVYCQNCGIVPVPQTQLPVMLPEWKGQGNPLLSQEFINCKCYKCGAPAKRQTDTMDTFVDSSWYFLRFLDSHNKKQICNSIKANQMMPVDIYIGGIEHAIMHLLYARFFMHFLSKQENICKLQEPFKELIVQGLVKGRTIKVKSTGKYLKQNQISNYSEQQLEETYEKMSKSKFNGVNPTSVVEKYGADTLRMALFFAAPPEHDVDFRVELLVTIQRFLGRVSSLINQLTQHSHKINFSQKLTRQQLSTKFPQFFYNIKSIIQKLEQSIQKRLMHAYIGNLMQLFNQIKKESESTSNDDKFQAVFSTVQQILIPVLSVVAPETTKNILLNPIFERQPSKLTWIPSSEFINTTQYLIMKGNKLLKKTKMVNTLTDNQITQVIKQQFKNNTVEGIKRNRRNIIVILR